MKARQSAKITKIGDALVAAGYLTLDQQAMALGLPRSTTWAVLQAKHKNSGLSATVIRSMLASRHLPPLVRATILEYVDEKTAGLYGHTTMQTRRFVARFSDPRISHSPTRRTNAIRQEDVSHQC